METEAVPSAEQAALLLIQLLIAHDAEKKRWSSRFRLSGKTLLRITGRAILTDEFTADLYNALYRYGFVAFGIDGGMALVEYDAVSRWVKISPKRVESLLTELEANGFQDLSEVKVQTRDYFTRKQRRQHW